MGFIQRIRLKDTPIVLKRILNMLTVDLTNQSRGKCYYQMSFESNFPISEI